MFFICLYRVQEIKWLSFKQVKFLLEREHCNRYRYSEFVKKLRSCMAVKVFLCGG